MKIYLFRDQGLFEIGVIAENREGAESALYEALKAKKGPAYNKDFFQQDIRYSYAVSLKEGFIIGLGNSEASDAFSI